MRTNSFLNKQTNYNMPELPETSIARLQESVENLSKRESEHHVTVLSELKDIKDDIKPKLDEVYTMAFRKSDFTEFYKVYIEEKVKQDTKIEKLEKRLMYYAGAAFIIGIIILGGWQYFLATTTAQTTISTTNITK